MSASSRLPDSAKGAVQFSNKINDGSGLTDEIHSQKTWIILCDERHLPDGSLNRKTYFIPLRQLEHEALLGSSSVDCAGANRPSKKDSLQENKLLKWLFNFVVSLFASLISRKLIQKVPLQKIGEAVQELWNSLWES